MYSKLFLLLQSSHFHGAYLERQTEQIDEALCVVVVI